MNKHINRLGKEIKTRDEHAFTELFKRHSAWIYRKAYSALRHHEDAEDAVQECFLKVWSKVQKWDDTKGRFDSWLVVVIRHAIIDEIRKQRRRNREHPFGNEFSYANNPESVSSFEHTLENREAERLIEMGLAHMSKPKHRCAWILHHLEGYTHKEVACILNRPVGSIKIWIFRAKAELREILTEKGYATDVAFHDAV